MFKENLQRLHYSTHTLTVFLQCTYSQQSIGNYVYLTWFRLTVRVEQDCKIKRFPPLTTVITV